MSILYVKKIPEVISVKSHVILHCVSTESIDATLRELDAIGHKWRSGKSLLLPIIKEEDIGLRVNYGLVTYADIGWFDSGYDAPRYRIVL